jgi:hypothetical protein
MTAITTEERAIYDEISRLGVLLWDASLNVVGLNSDPKMFSVMLFKRLWSNHRGYALLHNNAYSLEADIILRSGLEAAICIAANYRLREEFVLLMRRDAAYTLQGQIKVHREGGALDLVKDCEAGLRQLHAGLPDGVKAARLDWNTLAQKGQVPQLYGFHRMLSGVSSHVTGMSVLLGVVGEDGDGTDAQNEIRRRSRKHHLMMMAGATLQGSMLHAGMIGEDELARTAKSLVDQLNVISTTWT